MSRTGENIYKRKDGRWEGRYIKSRENGQVKYGSVYARTYTEVKRKLEYAKSHKHAPKCGKVADIGRQWLLDSSGSLKKASINKYEDILRQYILPEFGNTELSEVTNQQLISFANGLLEKGGTKKQGLSSATVAEILSAMNGIRVYAMKRDYSVAFSVECVNLKRESADIRVFSMEEEERFVNYLREHMDLSALGILICLFTGIRVGELCALKWNDIDLAEKKISVSKTMQRIRVNTASGPKTEIRILEPKSANSARVIPLPDVLAGLLEKYYVPEAYLLTGKKHRFVEPRTMQNRFKRLVADCGIQDANFHATRHTFATRCVELGFDVKSLSEILGHGSVAITMNRYVHPSMALKRENMNLFSNLFAVK